MKLGKRGISHLELITAILIFIFAIVVVIYFINFDRSVGGQKPLLDALEAKLREKVEIDFKKISLFIDSGSNAECFNISLHSDLKEEQFTFISGGIAFNFSDDKLWFLINNSGENFYEIYHFSDDITEDISLEDEQCIELLDEQYNYSIVYYGKIFAEEKILQLDDLGYDDFSITIDELNSFNIGGKPPAQVEVQAREIPVEIIREDGTVIKTIINIKVW